MFLFVHCFVIKMWLMNYAVLLCVHEETRSSAAVPPYPDGHTTSKQCQFYVSNMSRRRKLSIQHWIDIVMLLWWNKTF